MLAACGALAAGGGSHADDVFGDRPEESVSFRAGGDKTLIADDRAKYTIGFGADGRVRARIDCNGVMTTWKSPGPNQLHMGPPWLTRPLCTPGSVRDLVFLALMADAGADDFAAIGGAQATGAKSPVASKGPFKYECRQANGDKDTLIATFYETSPAMVLIERRGHARPAFRVPAASGSKYEGRPDFMFWDARGEAMVTWSGIGSGARPASTAVASNNPHERIHARRKRRGQRSKEFNPRKSGNA